MPVFPRLALAGAWVVWQAGILPAGQTDPHSIFGQVGENMELVCVKITATEFSDVQQLVVTCKLSDWCSKRTDNFLRCVSLYFSSPFGSIFWGYSQAKEFFLSILKESQLLLILLLVSIFCVPCSEKLKSGFGDFLTLNVIF